MDIHYSPRGTGACPLCKKQGWCNIRKSMTDNLAALNPSSITGRKEAGAGHAALETVVYICPSFLEKT